MSATVHTIGKARKLSLDEIRALAAGAGFPDPQLAAAVAMAESGGDPGVVGDLDLGISIGLWQINTKAHPDLVAAGELTDPSYNAKAALAVSKNGTTWRPWTTYRSGAYRAFLGDAPSKARTSSGSTPTSGWIAVAIFGWLTWEAFGRPGLRRSRRRRSAAA